MAFCLTGPQIREAVAERQALERVQASRQELNTDAVAKREFEDRLSAAKQAERAVARQVPPPSRSVPPVMQVNTIGSSGDITAVQWVYTGVCETVPKPRVPRRQAKIARYVSFSFVRM